MAHCFPLQEPNCRCTPDNAYHLYAKSILGIKSGSAIKANVGTRRKREFIPEEQKDGNYWFKRNRNNEAAKRSRQRKRMEEYLLETRAVQLFHENEKLKAVLSSVHSSGPDRPTHQDPMKHCFYDALGRTSFFAPSQKTQERGMDFVSYERLGRAGFCLPPLTSIGPPSTNVGSDILPVLYLPSSNLSSNCNPTCPFNQIGTYSQNEMASLDLREQCMEKAYSDTSHFGLNGTVQQQNTQLWEYPNTVCGTAQTGKVQMRPSGYHTAWLACPKIVRPSDPRSYDNDEETKDEESIKPVDNGASMPLLPHKLRFKANRTHQDSMNTYRCPSEGKLEALTVLDGTETQLPINNAQYLWCADSQSA